MMTTSIRVRNANPTGLRWWDKGEPNGEFGPVQKIVVGG